MSKKNEDLLCKIKKEYNIQDAIDSFIFFLKECPICREDFSFVRMKKIGYIGYANNFLYICKKCWEKYMINNEVSLNINHPNKIKLEELNIDWVLSNIDFDRWQGSRSFEKYCNSCDLLIEEIDKRFGFVYYSSYKDKGIISFREFKEGKRHNLAICQSCAKNKQEAAEIILNIIKKTQEENNMNVLEILSEEAKRLGKQLTDLETIKLPENMPQHIIDHLSMKKTLINNCVKSIKALQDNYHLDETIKKLFST